MTWKFVYVWGLRGPEGQVWNDDVARSQKPLDNNSNDIDEQQSRLAISALMSLFPYRAPKGGS